MSVLPKDSVRVVAQAHGFPDIDDDVAVALASDLEYRLREITQEATKFMRHSKRRRLTTQDINNALRHRNLEPIYGYSLPQPEPAKLEQLFRRAGTSDVFYIPDETVDLADFVNSTPLPKLPLDVTFSNHWLAIDGYQPAIPENPPIAIQRPDKPSASANKDGAAAAEAPTNNEARSDVVVRQKVAHTLSRELQMYYQNITEGLLGPDEEFRKQVLGSVRGDPGLHQLLPYFAQFIQEKVRTNLKNFTILLSMMHFVDALLANPNVFLEPYLHQVMPSVITCVVGKKLGDYPTEQNHWQLRDVAATLVAAICAKYANQYNEIQARVTKTLVKKFLSADTSLPTQYGAVKCLAQLGHRVVSMFLIDNIAAYRPFLEKKLGDPVTKPDAERIFAALAEAVGKYLKAQARQVKPDPLLPPTDESRQYALLHDFFGDRLTPYLS
eukprot:m.215330 g.215330  ORF g.215330 m.215330 type:complete len:440 (-) comp18634_c0_seq5:58-1377(-)